MDKNTFPYAGSKFSQNLAKLMKDAGDNTITLSAYLGRSSSAITHWLTGRYEPRVEMVDRISERYGVDPLWLMGIKDDSADGQPIPNEAPVKDVPFDFTEEALTNDMSPTIPKNSRVFIGKTAIIESGKVALVEFDGERIFRRIFRDERTIVLFADSPGIPPIFLSGNDRKRVNVIGRALRVIYELR